MAKRFLFAPGEHKAGGHQALILNRLAHGEVIQVLKLIAGQTQKLVKCVEVCQAKKQSFTISKILN